MEAAIYDFDILVMVNELLMNTGNALTLSICRECTKTISISSNVGKIGTVDGCWKITMYKGRYQRK